MAKKGSISKNSQSHLKVFKLDFDAILQVEPENLKLYSSLSIHKSFLYLFELFKDIYPDLQQIAIICFHLKISTYFKDIISLKWYFGMNLLYTLKI